MNEQAQTNLLQQSRREAVARYQKLAAPTRKNELFKYTYVGKIPWPTPEELTTPIKLPSAASLEPLLTPENAIVVNLTTISTKVQEFAATVKELNASGLELFFLDGSESKTALSLPLQEKFDSLAREYSDDKFSAWAAAAYNKGFFLHLRAGAKLNRPLHVIYGSAFGEHYRNCVVLGANAELVLVEEYRGVSAKAAPSDVSAGLTEYFIGENARFTYCSSQSGAPGQNHFRRSFLRADANSSVESTVVYVGGRRTQDRWEVELQGKGARFLARSVARLRGNQSVDFVGNVHHIGSHTESEINFWSVADEQSKVIFNGLVDVANEALHTDASQKNRGLLLSNKASIHSMPKLIIATNEVACAHGASIARVSDDQLFYLQSRGISKEEAKRLVVDGFTEPALALVANESLRDSLRRLVLGEASS